MTSSSIPQPQGCKSRFRRTPLKTLASLLLATLAGPSFANLITNGGFEQNTVNTGGSSYNGDVPDGWSIYQDLYPGNSPDTWDNNGVGGASPGTGTGFPHITAFQGTKWVGMAGEIGNFGWTEGIESSPFALNVGVTYQIALDMVYDAHTGVGYSNPGNVTIRLRKLSQNAGLLTTFANNVAPDQWEHRSHTFSVGTGGFYSLVITNEDARRSYLGVDSVELNAVPEPATAVVFVLGAGVCAKNTRRARQAADRS